VLVGSDDETLLTPLFQVLLVFLFFFVVHALEQSDIELLGGQVFAFLVGLDFVCDFVFEVVEAPGDHFAAFQAGVVISALLAQLRFVNKFSNSAIIVHC
jgi:hypothetical protein